MKHIVKRKHSANRYKSIIVNPVMQNMVKQNNIQIVGLNVNGLVSKVEHGVLEVYLNNFDIACLTETKIDHIEDDFLPNFHPFILGRKNKSHRYGGIHGICIMVKKKLVDFVSVVRETSDENVLWIKIDKGAFGLECILGAIYLPHEGSRFHSNEIFDILAEDIMCLESKYNLPIVLIGDFNARTGVVDDFMTVEDTITVECGLDEVDNAIFDVKSRLESLGITTERNNEDKKRCNNNGFQMIELCKSLNVKIINGRFGDDKGIGKLICDALYRGASTIDYALVVNPYINNKLV